MTSSHEGRDVVLTIDLTGSVRLNDEGRLRLKQIIQDSLHSGDSVYVVPFASTVNPLQPDVDCLALAAAIPFRGESADIERIIQMLPLNSSDALQNTDIQMAESKIYQGLAQLNQCRVTNTHQNIRSQSVVWLTDAPLLTKPGIDSSIWVETPATSPFRQPASAESQQRQAWLDVLPLQLRSQKIGNYNLSVVDLAPTVQEFCTPAPGGEETCLVNNYLFQQLWLPVLLSSLGILTALAAGIWWFRHWRSLQQAWKLTIVGEDEEAQICYLRHRQRLGIGSDIECRSPDIRGYLRREGNQLWLEPSSELPIYHQNSQVTQCQLLTGKCIRLHYPYQSRDLELTISIN